MALLDQYNETQTAEFVHRVQMAMCAAAINIQSEAANTLQSVDSPAAATSVTVVNGAAYSVNDLVTFGQGLGTAETRKVTAIAANVLTVTSLTNAHKAGEVTQKVIANHTNRANYAKLVLNAPSQYAILFTNAICANDATLTQQNDGTTTDATINTDVSSVFSALAGTV